MIKKWFGWFDVYYAEMLLGVAFVIINAWIGEYRLLLFGFRLYLVVEYSSL